jgi:hypothetical protein
LVAEFGGEITRGEHIDRHAKHLFQIDLKPAQVKQGSARKRIDQEIEVTSVDVLAIQDRTEYAGVPCPVRCDHTPNGVPMRAQGFRWLHVGDPLSIIFPDFRLSLDRHLANFTDARIVTKKETKMKKTDSYGA